MPVVLYSDSLQNITKGPVEWLNFLISRGGVTRVIETLGQFAGLASRQCMDFGLCNDDDLFIYFTILPSIQMLT